MRLFADRVSGPPAAERFAGPVRVRERPGGFNELEWRLFPGAPALVVYQARMTSSMSLLLACCGNAFDSTLAAVRRDGGDVLFEEMAEHWTSFAHMTANGQRGDLSDLGITLVTDPADGVKSGCVGTIVSPRGGESELKDGLTRVIRGGASAIGEGVEAGERSARIRGLLAGQADHAVLDGRLEAIAAAGFSFRDTRTLLDLEWPTG
ncbi:hypothetical protein SAMN05421504_101788 [Amycolatopsis xylanica]|uniref:Uncharacterized protein n=1 Tax=Amycolatopsis xylanica TaxID=589385 RepID=A0A1H2U5G8_9PSEU|nr:hypothetical protein [Amycolatopsis xylanica]SDW51310.1 hypothetical protein SAMN05421504_101788 [Amycolatopsis xylanica]